jgi:L-fucose isomerase-like protein
MERLQVALVAGSMPDFSDEGPRLFAQYRAELEKFATDLEFDLQAYPELILTEQKAAEVRAAFARQGVDLVLLFHPTYMIGDVACELMKAPAAVGLWAVAEPSRKGPLPLASLACLNQNSSIAAHYFKGRRKVKWFFGPPTGKYFRRRFEITVRALAAMKDLREAKVAQIGKIADGFRGMYYDAREIYKTLGVEVVQGIEIEDILAAADALDKRLVEAEAAKVCAACSKRSVPDAKIIESVKLFLATQDLCQERGFKAVAFSCWPKLGALRNMTACLAQSLLDSSGIPSACEGDLLSAVSMLVLRGLSRQPVAVMDLPAFDDEDQSVLLWHCGSAPFEMADRGGVTCAPHSSWRAFCMKP